MSQVKCELFNLGEEIEKKEYERLLNREADDEIIILDRDKSWGNKAEGVLFMYVTYKELEDF